MLTPDGLAHRLVHRFSVSLESAMLIPKHSSDTTAGKRLGNIAIYIQCSMCKFFYCVADNKTRRFK